MNVGVGQTLAYRVTWFDWTHRLLTSPRKSILSVRKAPWLTAGSTCQASAFHSQSTSPGGATLSVAWWSSWSCVALR